VLPGKKYKPEDVLQIAWRHKWMIVLPFLLVTLGATFYAMTMPDRYRSDTTILVVPQRVPENFVRSTVTTPLEDRLQSISQQILGRTRLERIILDLDLYAQQRRTGIMEDIVEQMRRDITMRTVRGDAFQVAYVSENPRTAMLVAERLASLFIEENLRDREVLAEGTNQFLESQLEEARRKLVETEQRLEAYRRQYSGQLPDQVASNLQVLSNAQMQLQALGESLNRDRDRRLVLERQIGELNSPEFIESLPAGPPGSDPTMIAGASAALQLEAARNTLRMLEMRLKPEHPDIVRMKRLIADLEKKAAAEAAERPLSETARPATPAEAARQNRLRALRAELENLDRQIAEKQRDERNRQAVIAAYEGRVNAAPSRETELIALTRDYSTLQWRYTDLLAKREDAQIAANLERRQIGEQFRIIDAARLPVRPFSPNRPRFIALASFAGLGLGFGLVALIEYRDRTLKTDEDVLVSLALPVIALIPTMATETDRARQRRRRRQISIATAAVALLAVAAVAVKLAGWPF
jgi:polysaccharide chain length determinant protein (PEP-CTERM system associated)